MLDGAIHFHRYSFRNMLLLLSQRPQATQIAGYRDWHKRDPPAGPGLNRREGDGRHDRKRQRGRAVVLARPTTDFLAATA
jgi:hypothetical protein